MRWIRTMTAAGMGLGMFAAAPAGEKHPAMPVVGKAVHLKFKSSAGEAIDLGQFKGKLVIIFVWAGWSGPSMGQADHIVQIEHRYGPRGVQIVGVNLDGKSADMNAAAAAHHFDWPEDCDVKGLAGQLATDWNIQGIPQAYLILTDGTLGWAGSPAEIDGPLEKAMTDHPPSPVDAGQVASADEYLNSAKSLIAAKKTDRAMAILAHIPLAAHEDAAFAGRFDAVAAGLIPAAEQMIAAAGKNIDDEKFLDAAVALKRLSLAMAGTPSGKKAQDMLADLQRDPDAKGALEAADKELIAEDALAGAQQLEEEKKDDAAYEAFKGVIGKFPGTAAAKSAAEEIARYDADPAYQQAKAQRQTEEDSRKARSLLSLGRDYAASGRSDLAKIRFNEIIEEYPNTPEAAEAKEELDKIGN